MSKKKVLVKAPALSASGYGFQSRYLLRALKHYEEYFDLYLINIPWGQTGFIPTLDKERIWIDELIIKTHVYNQQCQQLNQKLQYDISVQVTIPNEFINDLAPINIGYTAGIETDSISPVWVEKSFLMDRIIVVSNFAKEGFDNTYVKTKNEITGEILNVKCERPIYAIQYAVDEFEYDYDKIPKLELDLKYDFNFLVVAQWSIRKNIENTVRWWVEEFIDQEVGLILKTSLRNHSIMDREYTTQKLKNLLKDYPNRKCEVTLLHGDLDPEQMASLYRHEKIKGIISLSHGEGACLPLLDAATYELPIICPVWSGPKDFIVVPIEKDNKTKDKPLVCKIDFDLAPIQQEAVWKGVLEEGSKWCYPKQGHYKMRLREFYKNYSFFKSQAKQLSKYVKENFKKEDKYKQFAEVILGDIIKTCNVNDLPKVSLFTSVYNGSETIETFLEDITSQTIFKQKGELILVHPKTSPGYQKEKEIIEKYLKEYPNIIYKELGEDPGLYECWNIGAKLCTGEYIGNANLDDRRSKNFLERFSKELFLNQNIGLVYSDALITEKINETMEKNSSNGRRYNFPEYSFDNLKMCNLPHSCPLYRKELHEKFGYYDSEMRFSADWKMFLTFANNNVKMKKINDILYMYCFRKEGRTTNPELFPEKMKEEQSVYEYFKDKEEVK